MAIPTLGTLGVFLITLINGCFYDLRLSINKPTMFAPEQFEACFKEMMELCLKHKNCIQKIWSAIKSYVKKGEKTFGEIEKLIIVIDNIDRCPSDMAYQLLTDIKTFLSNERYNLIFVVPVDDEALKKHLFRRLNKGKEDEPNINKEKEEFLRKFFNVTLRIKPHQETDLHHFAHEIDKENKLGYNNDTLAIVAKEFADNPRRIIQLLNNLSGELALYEADFAKENETAICVALILHEEYPDFYKITTKDLNNIRSHNYDDANYSGTLNAFMRVSNGIIKRTSLNALQRIFTNTASIFNDLPDDIRESVSTFDFNKVIKFANANSDKKTNLVDFAIESLNMDVKYGATSQVTQWIDFYCRLYKANVFDDSTFGNMDALLAPFYQTAIPFTNCPNDLCYMANKMNLSGIESLRKFIIEYLKSNDDQENSNFVGVFKGYLSNIISELDCNEIASVVENYYVDNSIDFEIAFTDTQKRLLFGDSFVTKQIDNMTATDDEVHRENIIWSIKNNKKLSQDTYSLLFTKYIELFGETRAKTKEDYIELINQLLLVLGAIETSSITNQLQPLYDFVTKPRRVPNPQYKTQSQYDTQKSILDEIDEEQSNNVVLFCYEIMRISGGEVDVNNSISKLYSKSQETIIEGALKIYSLGVSIQSLAITLIDADDYNNYNVLSLLEVLLSRQNDGSMMLDKETIKTKINSLIDNATICDVETLIEKLVKDNQILDMVTEYVASLDSETINNLPISIAKHAVSTFNRNNAEFYKDNADFLILVLNQGNARQKKEVVRLMKDKINKEEDLDTVVMVLDNLETEDKNMLKTLVGELEEIKESETIDEETKKRVAELVNKLSSNKKKQKI